MTGVEEEMEVILVADIRGEQGAVEVGDTLVAVIASGIGIVEVEAYIQALPAFTAKVASIRSSPLVLSPQAS